MVQLVVQQSLLPVLKVQANQDTAHCHQHLPHLKLLRRRHRQHRLQQVLYLLVLPELKQLKAELDCLHVIVEGAVVHYFQKIFAESSNTKFHSNNCRQGRNLMSNDVSGDVVESYNYLVQI